MFSILTSKIFGGLALGLAFTLAFVIWSGDRREAKLETAIAKQDKVIKRLGDEILVLASNATALEQGLGQCNASVDAAARAATAIGRAGVNAVATVQKAGQASSARAAKAVQAMPAATCEDAEAILRSQL